MNGRLQRSNGALEIAFRQEAGMTRLAHLYQSDPCRALFPYAEVDDLGQTILLTTSGGLAGGDRVRLGVRCEAGASQVFTPQAAEKIYRTLGPATEISVALESETGAWLEWVPQETILFERSHLRRRMTIRIAAEGRLLAGDILSFGRAAHGEPYDEGRLFDRWDVWRGDRLIWADRLRIDWPKRVLGHAAGLAGARAIGTIVCQAEDGQAMLPAVREATEGLAARVGATVIDGLLVVRLMAPSTAALRGAFAVAWCLLRSRAAGLPSRMPRIWHS